jgi:hypothetical protein
MRSLERREEKTPMRAEMAYLMLNLRNNYVKIGRSIDPTYREATLQAEDPDVRLLATAPGGRELERILHGRFAAHRLRGEWFSLSGAHVSWMIYADGFSVNRLEVDAYNAFVTDRSLDEYRADRDRHQRMMAASEDALGLA